MRNVIYVVSAFPLEDDSQASTQQASDNNYARVLLGIACFLVVCVVALVALDQAS